MSSNFGSSKEAKISRQMNRSQKLKSKNTCKRQIQPHRSHPGLKIEAEAEARSRSNCPLPTKAEDEESRPQGGREQLPRRPRRRRRRRDRGRRG